MEIERNCYNCMYSHEWDWDGNGMCYLNRYKALCKSIGVCRHHRYDEDDKGDPEPLHNPQAL